MTMFLSQFGLSSTLGSSTLDEADSISIAAKIEKFEHSKKIVGQYSALQTCNIAIACLTETFIS
jgi:hypothetical protein